MRKMNSGKTRISAYSLVELLAVMVVATILLGSTLSFFYKGRNVCYCYTDKAMAAKATSSLKRTWREFIHANGEPFLVSPKKAAFKNGSEITIDGDKLIFETKDARRQLELPHWTEASMALEDDGQTSCISLRLDFAKGHGAAPNNFIRIVSAINPAEGGQDGKAK